MNFKRNKPRNDQIKLIWKQIIIKNKEGKVVINGIKSENTSGLHNHNTSYHNQNIPKLFVQERESQGKQAIFFEGNFLSSLDYGKKLKEKK